MPKTPDEIKKGISELEKLRVLITFNPATGEDIEPLFLSEENRALYDGVGVVLQYIQQLERDKAWAGEISDMLREENKRLEAENERLKYTLTGVMHFVDKWLDVSMYDVEADKNGQDAISRAAEARKVVLDAIEELQADNSQLNRCIENMTDKLIVANDEAAQLKAERDAAVETIYEMAKCIVEDGNYSVCMWCDQTECERLCMMHLIEKPGFKWRGVQKEE